MNEWIMSIMGVICLGILTEIVMPEGQTAKYVKGAFSLLVIFVIAAPLPKLLNKEFEFDFGDYEYGVDDAFAEDVYDTREKQLSADIEDYLNLSGWECRVSVKLKDGSLNAVESVTVTLYGENDGEEADGLRESVEEKFGISPDKVFVRYTADKGNKDMRCAPQGRETGGEYGSYR